MSVPTAAHRYATGQLVRAFFLVLFVVLLILLIILITLFSWTYQPQLRVIACGISGGFRERQMTTPHAE
ncbi:MAG: hypothetical protein WBY44_20770 [Bryobacteraceae bacterium]